MDWEHIRHVPVEDDQGNLVGLVTHRHLMRLLARGAGEETTSRVAVQDIMLRDVVTITPDTSVIDAVDLMRSRGVACLPVVSEGKLEGLVTEGDFLGVASRLFAEQLSKESKDA